MAVGDLYEVVVAQSLHGQAVNNVFHYQITVDPGSYNTVQIEGALATYLGANLVAKMKLAQASELTHSGIKVQRIKPLPRTAGVFYTGATGAGSNGLDAMASHTSVVISKRTPFVGRKYRGRSYFAGLAKANEANSELASTEFATWGAIATEMIATFTPTGLSGLMVAPVLLSQDGTRVTPITGTTLRASLHVQRRRSVGKGI